MENMNKKNEAVVHYVVQSSQDEKLDIGSVQLNKVLWYTDAVNYMKTGKSVTGSVYIKRQYGPVPRDILTIERTLVNKGLIQKNKKGFFNHIKAEYISCSKPDISSLSSDEIEQIHESLRFVSSKSAKQISENTHTDIWKIACIGEEIPLYAIFADRLAEINEDDIAWAEQEIKNAI
jgi:uncharacterized phage-associated protein